MANGMDLVHAIRAGEAEPPSGIRTLGLDQTHLWLDSVDEGRVQLSWPVGDDYLNLEGAVICSWTIAVADQALFFAGTTLCGEGEVTRMADLRFTAHRNITPGIVQVDATIRDRVEDRMFGRCEFTLVDGTVAATVAAVIDVVR